MSTFVHRLLRFGVYEMNLDTQELKNAGTLVKLSPQPFRLLEMLASRAGQIVTREEIQKQIWGDETYVDFERGVHKCINQIRNVLNDNIERPLYIETLPRKGYRFLAPVTAKTIADAPAIRESGPVDPGIELSRRYFDKPSETASSAPTVVARASNFGPGALAVAPKPIRASAIGSSKSAGLTRGRGLKWAIVALALLIVAVGTVLYVRSKNRPATGALTARENTVVLADFANLTGDPLFDDTLKQALTIQLEQSPYLALVGDHRIGEILRSMNLTPDQRLTLNVALDVCMRANAKAVLLGSIKPTGEKYQISLTALNCRTGESLTSAQATASNKQKVLRTIDQIGNDFRTHLGESLPSIKQFGRPLEDATTSSLEALQAYSQGRRAQLSQSEDPTAHYKKAIEIDPDFAYAYAALASYYTNVGENGLAAEYFTKAFALREHTSQREQYYIESHYYDGAIGDLNKAIAVYLDWIKAYPGDYLPHNNLNYIYNAVGQYEKAISEARQAVSLNSSSVNSYIGLMNSLLFLNRPTEANEIYQAAKDQKLSLASFNPPLYYVYFLSGNETGMKRSLEDAMGSAGVEDLLLALQADTEAFHGHIGKARERSQQAVDSAVKAQATEEAALWRATEALREAEVGNIALARAKAAEALSLNNSVNIQSIVAMTLARCGEAGQANQLATRVKAQAPLATITQHYVLPSVYAAIEVSSGNPMRAVRWLEETTPYQDGDAVVSTANLGNLYPVFIRGVAYLHAGKAELAANDFQYILDRPGMVTNSIVTPLARLSLARAEAMAGDIEDARKSYQDFLTLWKDADPDIPIYQQAKAEYARLR
jgi:DNA-binding winged helix-turn-helix (wHTH) protein/tetratricopeptide (TPR) repeat protein